MSAPEWKHTPLTKVPKGGIAPYKVLGDNRNRRQAFDFADCLSQDFLLQKWIIKEMPENV